MLVLGAGLRSGGVTSEEVERAIREGVRFLKSQQQPDGSWPEAEAQVKTGTTSLVTLALLTAGEKADSPTIQRGARVPARLRPGAAPQHLRHRAPDHGLRRRRARARPAADRSPTSTGWSRPRSSRATASPGRARGPTPSSSAAGRRQLQHPVRPAGPERRQRGRRPVKPEVWALRAAYCERLPEPRRRLGLHAAAQPVDRAA